MAVKMHPDLDMLLDYSVGGLSTALSVSISAHLHFCETCRSYKAQLEDIGGTLLDEISPRDMVGPGLDGLWSMLDGATPDTDPLDSDIRDTDLRDRQAPDAVNSQNTAKSGLDSAAELRTLPALIQNLFPVKAPQWRALSPSLQVAKIPVGEQRYELALHKIKAGGKTPNHDHRGLEVTVVLQGSFSDGNGRYLPGDFLVRGPGNIHRPIASEDEECICVSVVAAPIRLLGRFSKLLNPLLSFNPE
ncbi:MAG: ChrR family anti-sigma-E factor [Pseudomonadales bacterium]|nr:ChrR family anti-sigma-E factor [Pseudomonadales bacterium]